MGGEYLIQDNAAVGEDYVNAVMIEAQDLKKNYGDIIALAGISFSIRAGECFGFLGHNGAGKSTIMRMIYGLTQVEQGQLRVLGEPIQLTPPNIKQHLGIVPQDDNLDPDLSVIGNLIRYGRYYGMTKGESERRAKELLDFMSLVDKTHEAVDGLSGGLKRRLVIARALINQPQIVILDEPTTGLDPAARRLVWQKLRLLKTQGVTLVLTTHYMEEAAQLCDRLVIMKEGRILAEGSPAALIEQHVLPFVIEVHVERQALPPDLARRLVAFQAEWVETENEHLIFSANGKQVWEELDHLGIPKHACLLRSSQLEDVYLKLVGVRE